MNTARMKQDEKTLTQRNTQLLRSRERERKTGAKIERENRTTKPRKRA